MRTLPNPSGWILLCRGNHAGRTKHMLHSHGWVKNGPPPDPALIERVNACWAEVLGARADKLAACLPAMGFVPTTPYGPALDGAMAVLLERLVKQRYTGLRSAEHHCWEALLRGLPHVSDDQARLLAQAGRHEDLSLLLLRKAWAPSPTVFFETVLLMQSSFGHYGDHMLDAAQQANPGLAAADPDAFRRSLGRLLSSHADLFGRLDRGKREVADREAALVRLCSALEPLGGMLDSAAMLKIAERGNLELVAAMGRAGCALPTLPQAQKKFFAAALVSPFEGERDTRLQEDPWRTWVTDAVCGEWDVARNPAVVAVWRGWRLDQALTPRESVAAQASRRPRM